MTGKRRNIESSKGQDGEIQRDAANAAPGDFDDLTFRRLDVSTSPDFTRRVMGRLGYMRVSAANTRRERFRRWTNRSGVVLAAAIAIGVAYQFYENSQQVRRPDGLTVPTAIGNDVRQQQNRIDSVIRSIRSVVPIRPKALPATSPMNDDASPEEIEGDFDQPQSMPFRWV